MTELSPPFSSEFDAEDSWLRRKLAIVLVLAVVAGAAGGGYWYFNRGTAEEATVAQQPTAEATLGNLVSTLSTTGTAASTLSSKLTFGVAGRVVTVNAALGDQVEAGQVLATLDSADLERKVDSAQASLTTAQLRLSDLVKPATASELASASSAISSAQTQLANAEENLRKAQPGQDIEAIETADAAVAQAQQGLTSAESQAQSSWISLISAARNYCTTDNHLVQACYESDLPLSQAKTDSLIAEIRTPATSAVGSAASSFLSANTSYANAFTSVTNAEKTLASAITKRRELDQPPSALALQQLNSSIQSARASLLSAQDRYDELLAGPDAITLAQQQESVKSAQIAYETAVSNLDAVTLKAPISGTITAVGIAVGDNATAATQAFTITNTTAIRVDLSVQEADFVGLTSGQFGTVTFEALPDYTYVVRITAVIPTPTTTQGIVSYQVQAEVLSARQLEDPETQAAAVQALASLNGGGTFGGGRQGLGAGTNRGAGADGSATPDAAALEAQQTARAGGGFPGAQRTPGANGFPGGAATGQAGGAGLLQALRDAPSPTPGMNATVTILKNVSENVVLVPNGAIRTAGTAKSVVVLATDGTSESRVVQTGSSDGTNTIVSSGLAAGETVLVGITTAVTGGAATQPTGPFGNGGFVGGPGGQGATGEVR